MSESDVPLALENHIRISAGVLPLTLAEGRSYSGGFPFWQLILIYYLFSSEPVFDLPMLGHAPIRCRPRYRGPILPRLGLVTESEGFCTAQRRCCLSRRPNISPCGFMH